MLHGVSEEKPVKNGDAEDRTLVLVTVFVVQVFLPEVSGILSQDTLVLRAGGSCASPQASLDGASSPPAPALLSQPEGIPAPGCALDTSAEDHKPGLYFPKLKTKISSIFHNLPSYWMASKQK